MPELDQASALDMIVKHAAFDYADLRKGDHIPDRTTTGETRVNVIVSGKIKWFPDAGGDLEISAPAAIGDVRFFKQGVLNCPPKSRATAICVVEPCRCYFIGFDSLHILGEGNLGAERHAALADAIRVLSLNAGWDPYVELLKQASPTLPSGLSLFHGLRHPMEGGRRRAGLRMHGFNAFRRPKTLAKQGAEAERLYLVCNGFTSTRVYLQGDGHERVITAQRAPNLVGEFERPLPSLHSSRPEDAGPVPFGATVDVQADPFDLYRESVFALSMDYAEYLLCCAEQPSLDAEVSAIIRGRTLQWLGHMAAGGKARIRVAQLLLSELARNDGKVPLRIPRPYFHAFCGGVKDQPFNVLKNFTKEKLLEYEERDHEGCAYFFVTSLDVAKLKKEHGGTGRQTPESSPSQS